MAATLTLLTEREFRTSRYAQVADNLDGPLSEVIAQAEAQVQSFCDRTFKKQTFTEYVFPKAKTLFLRNYPIVSVTSIDIRYTADGAWTTQDLSKYRVMGGAGMIQSLVADLSDAEVKVVYEAGYDLIPADIKAAVMLQTVLLSYQDFEVFGAGDSKKPGILYMQDQINALLEPYVRRNVSIL